MIKRGWQGAIGGVLEVSEDQSEDSVTKQITLRTPIEVMSVEKDVSFLTAVVISLNMESDGFLNTHFKIDMQNEIKVMEFKCDL